MGGNAGKVGLVLAVVALVAGGAWFVGRGSSAPPAAPTPKKADWASAWKAAGFEGARANRPDRGDASLTRAASGLSDAKALQARFDAWRAAKQLTAVSLREARQHPMRDAATLLAAVTESRARPAHPIEAAWLARAMCDAAKLSCAVVVDAGGLQTPLLLSHLRAGVQVGGGGVVSPLGATITTPKALTDAEAVALWLLVRAQAERGRQAYKDAHADIALAERLTPNSSAPAFARGVVQIDQGLVERGLDTCEVALAKADDPFARLFLADVLAAMDKPFKAYQHAQKVVTAHPKLAEARVSLALLDAGRAQTAPEGGRPKLLAQARAGFEKAIALDPEVSGARAGLAQIALIEGKTEQAESLLKEAVDKHGDTQAALVLAELLGMSQRADEAATMLKKLDRKDDERFVAALIKALATSGDVEGATKEAEAAHKRFPKSAQVGLLRADLLRQQGKTTEAIAALEPFKKGPDGVRIAGLQAQLLLQSGEHAKALAVLEPLIDKDPRSKELALLGVVAYTLAGKADKRSALIKQAVGSGVLGWLDVAGVLIEAGDAKGAEATLKAGLEALGPAGEQGQQLAVMLSMVLTASQRKAEATAMRDAMAAKIGDADKKRAFTTAVDQAIAGAEAELQKMAAEPPPAGAQPAPGAGAPAP